LAVSLGLGDPHALEAASVHLQSWQANKAAVELAWQEVKSA
jgi:hypothetical protein